MTGTEVGASHAANRARNASQRLRQKRGYHVLVAVGLVCYGVVHLLIAWIALQIAWGSGGNASQQGALTALAKSDAGPALLGVVAAGMLTLALWQAVEAAFGYGRVAQEHDEGRRTRKRLSSAGRAAIYLVLGISALRLVLGEKAEKNPEEGFTRQLMDAPLGWLLVVALAAAILAVGVSQVLRGIKHRFTEDLRGDRTETTLLLGTVGYVAKGVAFAVIAALFGWAAVTYEPKKAGGLDAALHTIGSQPAGSVLLTALALGFAAFGLYCFVWARNARS